MANKKFRTTENAIFIAYCKLSDFSSAKIIAKKAGISRSTLYRHHQTPRLIPRDYEQYLLETYTRRIRSFLIKDETNLRTIFFRTLLFIHNNRAAFMALFQDRHQAIIGKMLAKIKSRVLTEWRLNVDTDKLFKVYQNEILGIIEIWAKSNFSISKLDKTLNDIIYLTKTSPKRLVGIL